MKKICLFLLFLAPALLPAEPLYSSIWGFFLDLPEGYEFFEGNNTDRYSFQGPNEAMFDVAAYKNAYPDVEQLANDINRRLGNAGDTAFFEYGGKNAALIELRFGGFSGWGFCVELDSAGEATPMLLALAYAPEGKAGLDIFHLSALDSVAPSAAEKRIPGPITEFSYPRGRQQGIPLAGTQVTAMFRENDAEAAQALVDREFSLLLQYQTAPNWQEAWVRYYRAICRDSWDRVADALSRLQPNWSSGSGDRAFAEKALQYVQGFNYERNLEGSDFINLVNAVIEKRGDCDSRAMLWAMILMQANIPAAIMVSQNYSHAMGLADIPGAGARFESSGVQWLVAETTKEVGIGLINQDMSATEHWLGVVFE